MIINRKWEMPNSKTFKIRCIKELIKRHLPKDGIVLDPFANEFSIKEIMGETISYFSNDLNPEFKTDYNLEAQDFMKEFDNNSVDLVLYDPPYSGRQVSECYRKLGRSVNMEDTNSGYWVKFKKEISRIIPIGGKVISFGWNSNGVGKKYGFEIEEILLIAHGGGHYDTICVVEKKVLSNSSPPVRTSNSTSLTSDKPKGFNISLKESPKVDSQISSNDETSLNNNIMFNKLKMLQSDSK